MPKRLFKIRAEAVGGVVNGEFTNAADRSDGFGDQFVKFIEGAAGLKIGFEERVLCFFQDGSRDAACLNAPDELLNVPWPPLMRIRGIGPKGFWSVVRALTNADLGDRCNQEWGRRLDQLKRERNRQ